MALSDGVFAIVITLLVLEVHVPDPPSRRLGVLVVALPVALYVVAIVIAERLPVASLWIYAGAPILYFLSLFISRSQAPPGAAERDFT